MNRRRLVAMMLWAPLAFFRWWKWSLPRHLIFGSVVHENPKAQPVLNTIRFVIAGVPYLNFVRSDTKYTSEIAQVIVDAVFAALKRQGITLLIPDQYSDADRSRIAEEIRSVDAAIYSAMSRYQKTKIPLELDIAIQSMEKKAKLEEELSRSPAFEEHLKSEAVSLLRKY